MQITRLRTNHLENPLGFDLCPLTLSWVTEQRRAASTRQAAAQLQIALDADFAECVYDSGRSADLDSRGTVVDIELKPRTRYFWRVTVWGDQGEQAVSEKAWFETGKLGEDWHAEWIVSTLDTDVHPLVRQEFEVKKELKAARAYVCGLGLYELHVNGQKVGDECLMPGYHAYDLWLQYQTYDITEYLQEGRSSAVGAILGSGWYKGRFGFEGGTENIYGDSFGLICEIVLTYADGTAEVVGSGPSWVCAPSAIQFSGIYDGEVFDARMEKAGWAEPGCEGEDWRPVRVEDLGSSRLTERLSPRIVVKHELKPVEVITSPAGETILDMGQNMTGWIRFRSDASPGTELKLQFGELLQNGNFYRENLRAAKAEHVFVSDGTERVVEPRFTFFGFRYVKLTGFEDTVNPDDFTGCVIYSDLDAAGSVETSNPLVNRLFQNAVWGQRGNFLDVPTDCPQRDERMGWTGDAQVFAGTACFNMYSPAFYRKYMHDLRLEQEALEGSVPFVVPRLKAGGMMGGNHGSAAWGDAATVIPWTLYLHYGDIELLRQQFNTMRDWVDYIYRIDESTGGTRLWQSGFHFGDWLALDGEDPQSPMGGTDSFYVASAYYCYSARLVAQAAAALGYADTAAEYFKLVEEIKAAIKDEYFTPAGRSAIDTQTAMVTALYMDLVPENFRPRLINDLKEKLRKDNMHLKTGFVGTPYLCPVLSDNGANESAYRLLLNDDYPSWLYAVKMGATTIWERWNSVLPDGSISDTGMNSLNHYAYGSIAEWMYQSMCGIRPTADGPGFKTFKLEPRPHGRLRWAAASLQSAMGLITSSWEIQEDGTLIMVFTVPFGSEAEIRLPDAPEDGVAVNGVSLQDSGAAPRWDDEILVLSVEAGVYKIVYAPTTSYILAYSTETSIGELLENPETKAILFEHFPVLEQMGRRGRMLTSRTLRELAEFPMTRAFVSHEQLDELDSKLKTIRIPIN